MNFAATHLSLSPRPQWSRFRTYCVDQVADDIQKMFESVIAELASQFVMDAFLKKRLAEQGIELSASRIRKLANQLRANKTDVSLPRKYSHVKEIDLTLNDEDNEFLEKTYLDVVKAVATGENGLKAMNFAAKSLVKDLNKNWPDQHKWEMTETGNFRQNLERRWGKGLSKLRMMLTITREIGGERSDRIYSIVSEEKAAQFEVLRRLHIRACQVISEILALLEGGFADGAIARWRTLYEIETVMALVGQCGNEMAERYLAHEVVESRKASELYDKCYENLGFQPIDEKTKLNIENDYKFVLDKYGKEFGNDYGWASKFLNKTKPNLFDLVEAAGEPQMKSYYKMASHNVHAGVKGITFKIGALGQSPELGGASNAGFEEPGQLTACSIARITSFLLADEITLDETFYCLVLNQLRDQAIKALMAAADKLKKDDAKLRKKLEKAKTDYSEK